MHRLLLFLVLLSVPAQLTAQAEQKNRLIVLSDIEADPDDTQSFVRLLLYSNEIELRGLIATTSCWMKNSVHPESITRIIGAYEKVQPNLALHDADFPTAAALYPLVKKGLPAYGMEGVGKGKDSEGSDWIIRELSKKDERPLWIAVWGGSNTLAQALHTLKAEKTEKELEALVKKLRVYAISDQDDSGIWIRNNFPGLFYIVSPGDDYGSATWNAINSVIPGIDNHHISNSWLAQNIQQGHGPLGAVYPDVAWGMEGDTPSWLNLIPNELSEPEHPEWGGWGGRYEFYKPDFSKQKKGGSGVPFEPETREIWSDAPETYTPWTFQEYNRNVAPAAESFSGNKVSLWRWREDFQNDFAARMDWCTMSPAEANHAPEIVLSHPDRITVKAGQGFGLDAFGTTDPDGDSFTFLWFSYPEAGTYREPIKIQGAENSHGAYIIAPPTDRELTAHFILKVTDRGEPALTSYKRVIVTIKP
ncbi:MAG: nucleoside hydrolase-like domain-containing protein [Bacteroidota bacterium]